MNFFIKIIVLLYCFITICKAQEDFTKFRLSSEVIPKSYALKLQPIVDKNYFKGETSIEISIKSDIETINLHANFLNISDIKIKNGLGNVVYKLNENYEIIEINYENGEKFLKGEYILYIKYEGKLLHDDQMGFVKSQYFKNNGTEKLLVTDFQPTYARRAFPCFDEPAFKAIFNISIIAPDPTWTALSNTDELSRELTEEGVIFTFESTPLMSTELTSFVLTKMNYLEKIYKDGDKSLKIRTYFGNAQEENNTAILDFTKKSVDYFKNFTGIEYPMSKIDFIEYDKKYAATEYWGLTTFKSGLLNPSLDLYDDRQISVIVAHEITHYWFGNLVTNKWWSDIWLQEGFAQYLSDKVVDDLLNTNIVDEYPLQYTIKVFKDDRDSEDVHPIVTNCTTPEQIMIQFNDITYIKAGSIIRLLNFLVGNENFKKIIQKYFKTFSYKSANTNDFNEIVENMMPNQNFKDFLETWLYQNRYPMINIEDNLEKKQYVLRQNSASKFKETDNLSPFNYRWTIPILYTTDLNKNPTLIWFKKEDDFVTIPRGNESFIKLNYNYMGIYYTNYTTTMWQNLIDHIQTFNSIEQNQLVLEAEKLFEADIINCDISLKLLSKIHVESNEYEVSAISVLYTLRDKLHFDKPAVVLLRKFFYSVRANSNLARKNISVVKVRRETVEQNKEKPHPRYFKCAKWITNNLDYLM